MFNIINSAALFRLWIRDEEAGFHGALATKPKDALIIFILPCKLECHKKEHNYVVSLCKSV
jgi:hypothetical protein